VLALARQVARWITTPPSKRGLQAAEALGRLLEHCPELDRTHNLVRQFDAMLDARDAAPLPDWLEQLTASRLPPLASLAKAIREDQSAVVQGITTPFNSGVNEGRITDLKLQKRIMAGRAGPLLRHRVTPPHKHRRERSSADDAAHLRTEVHRESPRLHSGSSLGSGHISAGQCIPSVGQIRHRGQTREDFVLETVFGTPTRPCCRGC
jgi:Transposase and inactivated derivatives